MPATAPARPKALFDAIGDAVSASLETGTPYAVIQFAESRAHYYAVSRTAIAQLAPHTIVTPFYRAEMMHDGALSIVNADA